MNWKASFLPNWVIWFWVTIGYKWELNSSGMLMSFYSDSISNHPIISNNVIKVVEFSTCWYKISLSYQKNEWAYCGILWIEIEWCLQKLDIILENRISKKLKVGKRCKNGLLNLYSQMIFFLNSFIFNIEKSLRKYNSRTFWGPGIMSTRKIQWFLIESS